MRLDKYLKVSRLIKRRPLASEACASGRVKVNEVPRKASYEVKEGDKIEITFGERQVKVIVLSLNETVGKTSAANLYRFS